MIEILYIITMYFTLRSVERVAQMFNSSSIHSHQQVVALNQRRRYSSNKCWGMPGNRCNSFTNYGGKSELYPVPIYRFGMGTVPDNIRGE